MTMQDLLDFSVQQGASDLHISAGSPPVIRIDGDIEKINMPKLSANEAQNIIYEIMNEEQINNFEKKLEADFSVTIPNLSRFRVNVFMQNRGIAAAIRTIPSKVLSLDDIKAPDVFKQLARLNKGLILVTGPTGSGKSTTLAAMVDYINENYHHHILTIEDPIEFLHESKKSLINQREVHKDTKSFGTSLRSALREDPDIILVGELRDLETVTLALTAAETGHLVLATLHTNSAAKTIHRIVEIFPAEEQQMIRTILSESLNGVISQILLKRKTGGRIAVHEIMLGTTPIRNLIRENKVPQMYSIIETSQKEGMQTLDQHLCELVEKNLISKEDAYARAKNKDRFESV